MNNTENLVRTASFTDSLDIINSAYLTFADDYALIIEERVEAVVSTLKDHEFSLYAEYSKEWKTLRRAARLVIHWQEEAREFPKNGWTAADMRRLYFATKKLADNHKRQYGIELELPQYTGKEADEPTPDGVTYGEHMAVFSLRAASNCDASTVYVERIKWEDDEYRGMIGIDSKGFFDEIYYALRQGCWPDEYEDMYFVDALNECFGQVDLSSVFGAPAQYMIDTDGEFFMGFHFLLPSDFSVDRDHLREAFGKCHKMFLDHLASKGTSGWYDEATDQIVPWYTDAEPVAVPAEEINFPVPLAA